MFPSRARSSTSPLRPFAALAFCSSLLGFALLFAAAQPAPADPSPAVYTWPEAVAAGLPETNDFIKDPGVSMADCPPIDTSDPGLGVDEEAPVDAPECWQRPEEQDLRFVVSSTPLMDVTGETLPPVDTHRHIGASAAYYAYKGDQNAAEISDPAVCHSSCSAMQHFYSRLALISSGGHSLETGWAELNYVPNLQGQYAATARDSFTVVLHGAFPVTPGSRRGFRAKHCGLPGQLVMCSQIFNGGRWRTMGHPWRGFMRCQNADGSANCRANFFEESFADDGVSWFALNGGIDGLRMRNIRVWSGATWPLYSSGTFIDGSFRDEAPYFICQRSAWYHYSGAQGLVPDCNP